MVTPPLPPADAAYGRDVDRAYRVYGHAILALLGPYTREADLRRAMDTFNAAVREQDIAGTLQRSVVAAQVALRERYAARYAQPQAGRVIEPEEPYRTKTGKILTGEDLEALAGEAERGYDPEQLRRADEAPVSDDDDIPEEDW